LQATRLILCGLTTDSCVLFTANDACLRGYEIFVPENCSAAVTRSRHSGALGQMRRTLKARTDESVRIDFEQLLKKVTGHPVKDKHRFFCPSRLSKPEKIPGFIVRAIRR